MIANLGELGQQAERARQLRRQRAQADAPDTPVSPRRGVGPSKVGNRLKDVSLPDPPAAAAEAATQPPAEDPPPAPLKHEPDTARAVPAPEVPVEVPLNKATIWLSADEQRFLDSVAHTGHGRSPRISLSRSAITRLAITRLAEQLTPDQIVDALSAPVQRQNTTGRPRR